MRYLSVILGACLVSGCSIQKFQAQESQEEKPGEALFYKRNYSQERPIENQVYAETWDEIQQQSLIVFCGNYVIEFMGKVAMYPALNDKKWQYEPTRPHYIKPEHGYSRNPYYWRISGNLLFLTGVSSSRESEIEFTISHRSNGELFIKSPYASAPEACIVQRH